MMDSWATINCKMKGKNTVNPTRKEIMAKIYFLKNGKKKHTHKKKKKKRQYTP